MLIMVQIIVLTLSRNDNAKVHAVHGEAHVGNTDAAGTVVNADIGTDGNSNTNDNDDIKINYGTDYETINTETLTTIKSIELEVYNHVDEADEEMIKTNTDTVTIAKEDVENIFPPNKNVAILAEVTEKEKLIQLILGMLIIMMVLTFLVICL